MKSVVQQYNFKMNTRKGCEGEQSTGGNVSATRSVEPAVAHAVSIRVPTFWPEKISLWFRQLEAQFSIAGISRDSTKFGYVLANLEPKYVEEVEDVIENPPEEGQYEALKAALIKRLTDSSSMRVRKLLEGEEIGDRTPSQFLRHLKNLAGTSVNEDFLQNLWMTRLPVSTQHVMAGMSDKSLTAMAEVADRVHEIRPEKGRISAVSQDNAIAALKEELMQLIHLEISAISRTQGQHQRSRSRGRGQPGFRRTSQNRDSSKNSRICWYHNKFGEKATKCREPCAWKSGNESSHH